MIRTAVRAGALATGLLLAGCLAGCTAGSGTPQTPVASSPVPVAPSSSAPAGSPSSSPALKEVSVTVAGRKVRPSPGQVEVKVGERVRVTVTSDAANQVHVHGVDVERELPAGEPVSFVVAYDQPGVYEVELHHPALLLFQFAVR